jgi:uncharacterized protein YpmB
MRARQIAIIFTMIILIILLVAPVYFLKSQLSGAETSTPEAQLISIARSLAGDSNADEAATKALTIATKIIVNGEVRYRIIKGGKCWEIEPSSSDEAYKC